MHGHGRWGAAYHLRHVKGNVMDNYDAVASSGTGSVEQRCENGPRPRPRRDV